jgi:AcrR family transcriptional regulator
MARTYVKFKRAENQAETRQRIVDAAVALHGEIGPVATTISMIADRAGVQRHTVYAHFPDERSLLMACSGLHRERHPPPEPSRWDHIEDLATRVGTALRALYGWFAETERMIANVRRDSEQNPVLREVSDMRFGSAYRALYASFSGRFGPQGEAALRLATSFYTWRTLVREVGLGPEEAIALMTRTILNADPK